MNKRILLSLGLIAVAGTAAAVIGTRAFFTDTETSTGNTFQAGNLDLQIDSTQHYDGLVCTNVGNSELPNYAWQSEPNTTPARPELVGQPCTGTWAPKSLVNEKFFYFTDLKPGDWGENTISFHVGNDAWMCANVADKNDDGKVSKYLSVFWWVDNGDNVYQSGEKVLYGGPRTLTEWFTLAGGLNLPLTFADSYLNWETWTGNNPGNTIPIPANTTKYLGVGWCFGTLNITGTGTPGFTCDGGPVLNDAQNGIFVGDLSFSVEQARNNADFRCPENVGKTISVAP